MHDFQEMVPGITVKGIDISKYVEKTLILKGLM